MGDQMARYVARTPIVTATPLRQEEQIAAKWKVELPTMGNRGTGDDAQFGGCRGIEDSYNKLDQIGEGTYGQVYLARDNKKGELVALKKIRMDNEKEGFPITAIREIKLLKNLSHENVINLKEIVRSQTHKCNNMKGSIYMVFDYMDHDLTGLMERVNYKFSVPHVKCYMKQLLKGLAYCHKQGVLHRDLKAANLLLNNEGKLKLADFGLARKFRENDDSRFTNRVITLWYRPPELLLGSESYGPEVDMWSVGCIFAELLIGKPLFPGKDETDLLEKISQKLGSPTEENFPGCTKLKFYNLIKHKHRENRLRRELTEKFNLPPGATDLLERMLCLDPKKRISAADAYFNDFFWAMEPRPCDPKDLPKYEKSHELDMKRKRADNREGGHRQGGHHGHGHHDAKRQRHGPSGGPHQGQGAYGGSYMGPPQAGAPHRAPPMALPMAAPQQAAVPVGGGYRQQQHLPPAGGHRGGPGPASRGVQRRYAAPAGAVVAPVAASGYPPQQAGAYAVPQQSYASAQQYPAAQGYAAPQQQGYSGGAYPMAAPAPRPAAYGGYPQQQGSYGQRGGHPPHASHAPGYGSRDGHRSQPHSSYASRDRAPLPSWQKERR